MILKTAWANLLFYWPKTLAIVLTVATGVGALFIFQGFNNGIMNQYRENTIRSRYGNAQVNSIGYRSKVYQKPWLKWLENPEAIEKKLNAIPEISEVFPRIEFFSLISNGNFTISGKGQGIVGEKEAKFFNTLNIIEGKALTIEQDGVLLGKGLSDSLDVKPGDRISVLANTVYGSINGVDLEVTGIFHTGVKEFDDVFFRLPLKQAQSLLDTEKVEKISLSFKKNSDWESVNQKFSQEFSDLEITPFEVLDKIYYQNAVDWLGNQFNVIQIIIIIIIILGIFNSVSSGILERRKEFCALRANGESSFEVIQLIGAESIIMGFLGGLLGLGLSYLIVYVFLVQGIPMPPSPGLTRSFSVFVELEVPFGVYAICIGLITTIFSSFLGSLKVVNMPISDGLRL